ncbi:hypothetical protein BBG19_0676 [Francisella sp. MA067296]|nr:hypothetical protein BBG19_0676 [Francisella sp. MA067296]
MFYHNCSAKQKLDISYNLCNSVKTNIFGLRRRIQKTLVAQYG